MSVRYPFDYGLSYTPFACSGLRLSAREIDDTQELTADVSVTNTGSRTGKAVAQSQYMPLRGGLSFTQHFDEPRLRKFLAELNGDE